MDVNKYQSVQGSSVLSVMFSKYKGFYYEVPSLLGIDPWDVPIATLTYPSHKNNFKSCFNKNPSPSQVISVIYCRLIQTEASYCTWGTANGNHWKSYKLS